MKRRNFLKSAAAIGASRAVPFGFSAPFLANQAYAFSPNYTNANIVVPEVMPQVINIFMYGGASELAGNLTNIVDISQNSQNDYSAVNSNAFRAEILENASLDNDGQLVGGEITPNGFWRSSGGSFMEDMLASDHMSVYRTIYKQKNRTRSHRDSIFMSHKGSLDLEGTPGIGTRVANLLYKNASAYAGAVFADGTVMPSDMNELVIPFISFEGDSTSYSIDPDNPLPLNLRGLTMNSNFDNPYTRDLNQGHARFNSTPENIQAFVEARLAQDLSKSRYQKAYDAFDKRQELEEKMNQLGDIAELDLPILPAGDPDANGNNGNRLEYPNNSFSNQIRAAVTLALANPQTMYITAGTAGLGGWDDHNNGIDRYPNRMRDVMATMRAAMKHIQYAVTGSNSLTTINGQPRTRTDNIIINIFGDFGRLVNLNNSGGWDHANNQNLYTFGGAGIRPGGESALGKVVGTTVRNGTSKTNNQYTVPTSDSPTFEPMSIASSIYGYFGVQNPDFMTADPENNPNGDSPIDETLPGNPQLFEL